MTLPNSASVLLRGALAAFALAAAAFASADLLKPQDIPDAVWIAFRLLELFLGSAALSRCCAIAVAAIVCWTVLYALAPGDTARVGTHSAVSRRR